MIGGYTDHCLKCKTYCDYPDLNSKDHELFERDHVGHPVRRWRRDTLTPIPW